MPQPPVLLLSDDPMAAALLGAAVELAGARPVFAALAESPRDALLRVRPVMVFVDCDERACAESFLGPVMMTGAHVVIFRSPRSRRDVSDLVTRLGIRSITLPADSEAIPALVRACLEGLTQHR